MTSQSKASINRHSSALVVGLGVTGFSVVRYLRQCGISVSVVDSRDEPPLKSALSTMFPEVEYRFGDFPEGVTESLIVVSPGVSLATPFLVAAKKLGSEIVGDIELFLQANLKPVIAITGSNGKSTVTSLVGHMLNQTGFKVLVAGNIGNPALDALVDKLDYEVVVLELSSFQLETTSIVGADTAAILNISADHQDRYPTMGDYVLAKAKILRGSKRAVLPAFDDAIGQVTTAVPVNRFALSEPANDDDYGLISINKHDWLVRGKTKLMRVTDIPLKGSHNVSNVLSSFALVSFLNLPIERLREAVKTFLGLPHRMQSVASFSGVTWINDSKATNVGATKSAIASLSESIVWLAGGQGKGADFSDLRDVLPGGVKALLVFGEDAEKLQKALEDLIPVTRVASLEEAVELAYDLVERPGLVLLSPACASFDMFKSFEHRGQVFTDCVAALQAKRAS